MEPHPIVVAACDPGIAHQGWAVVSMDIDGGFDILDKGVCFGSTVDVFEAAESLALANIAHMIDYEPDVWCVERQGVKLASYIMEGMLASFLVRIEQTVNIMSPLRMKKLVTDNGLASKAEVREAVTRFSGVSEFASWDESDACGLGIAGAIELSLEESGMLEIYEKSRKREHSRARYQAAKQDPATYLRRRERANELRRYNRKLARLDPLQLEKVRAEDRARYARKKDDTEWIERKRAIKRESLRRRKQDPVKGPQLRDYSRQYKRLAYRRKRATQLLWEAYNGQPYGKPLRVRVTPDERQAMSNTFGSAAPRSPRMKPYHKDRTPTSNMDGVKGRAK